MTNPETCRHWMLTPYGWSMVRCFSCGVVFEKKKLPFNRNQMDYIWSEVLRGWEYQSPEPKEEF